MIKVNFDKFVDALENDETELFNEIMVENIYIDSSAIGEINGIEEAKKKFKWNGIKTDYYKAKIFNNTVRTSGNKTWQTFYSVLIMGKEENGFMNLFQCCFINAVEWIDDKMISLKSNMTFECGNTLIVSNWWSLIDYKIEYGCARKKILDGVKDNPWINCPINDNKFTDQEQIRDTFNHYCLSLDLGNFDDLSGIATSTMTPYDGSSFGRDVWINNFKKQWARTVKFNGQTFIREAVWNHINTFIEIKIDGERAETLIYRFEPNRIGTRFQHKYNLNSHYYSYIWHMEFKKEDNTWKLSAMLPPTNSSERGPWQVEYSKEQRYF